MGGNFSVQRQFICPKAFYLSRGIGPVRPPLVRFDSSVNTAEALKQSYLGLGVNSPTMWKVKLSEKLYESISTLANVIPQKVNEMKSILSRLEDNDYLGKHQVFSEWGPKLLNAMTNARVKRGVVTPKLGGVADVLISSLQSSFCQSTSRPFKYSLKRSRKKNSSPFLTRLLMRIFRPKPGCV